MRIYWEVARRSFRRWSTYRAATVAGVITNTVFGIIQAYVLLAVYEQRADVGGLDASDALTYTFLAQGFLMPVGIFGWTEIADRVRTGEVVTDLYRPVDFQAYWLAQDLGRATYHALARGVPPYLFGALLFDLRVSTEPWTWAAFAVSVVLAVIVSFGVRFAVNSTAFWLLDIRGPLQLVTAAWIFLSGAAIPVSFFPGWLEDVARALPFASIVHLPIEIMLGKHDVAGALGVLAIQAAWAVALFALGRVVLAAATRKIVVQGG